MAVKSSALAIAVMTPVAILGWFLLPPVILGFFPKYAVATQSAQWMLVAAVFSGAMLGRSAIWSVKDWTLMTCYQVLGAVFMVGGPLLGTWLCSESLTGVSLGYVGGQIAWCPIGWYFIYRATHTQKSTAAAVTSSE